MGQDDTITGIRSLKMSTGNRNGMLLHRQTHFLNVHLAAGRPEAFNFMNLPGRVEIQAVMLQEPLAFQIPIISRHPGNTHTACGPHGNVIDGHFMTSLKIQRILCHHLLVNFGRDESFKLIQKNEFGIHLAK